VLAQGPGASLRPIVFINKIDRRGSTPSRRLTRFSISFWSSARRRTSANFPYLFGSGMGGFAKPGHGRLKATTMKPLFDAILRHVPPPVWGCGTSHCSCRFTTLDYSDFLGRISFHRAFHNGVIPLWPDRLTDS